MIELRMKQAAFGFLALAGAFASVGCKDYSSNTVVPAKVGAASQDRQ